MYYTIYIAIIGPANDVCLTYRKQIEIRVKMNKNIFILKPHIYRYLHIEFYLISWNQ